RLAERLAAEQDSAVEPDPSGLLAAAQAVRSLPEPRRTAFALTQVLGLSYAEAAQVAGFSVGTIRSRVARARDDLMRALQPAPRPSPAATGPEPMVPRQASAATVERPAPAVGTTGAGPVVIPAASGN